MRIKRGVNAVKKRRKILKLAKGYFGAKSKLYRIARQAVMKSLAYSYVGRKHKKRDFRKLWITRINAECRVNDISYSKFINGLNKAGVIINRKMLSEMATNDKEAFANLVKLSKDALEGKMPKEAKVEKKVVKEEKKETVKKAAPKKETAKKETTKKTTTKKTTTKKASK